MAQGQVLVDFFFSDGEGNSVTIEAVDLMRLTPALDGGGALVYPEYLLEEFNRFGLNFRGEHKEFTMRHGDDEVDVQPYRVNITNNCLASTKFEFAITSEDYHDFGLRCKSDINLNQNKILSHSWFYLNADLYAALVALKNPGIQVPLDVDYNALSDSSENVVVDFETLRNPIRREVDLQLLEVGHKSERIIEPLDVEEFYKREFGLLMASQQFTYASILEQPVQTMQFQDRGYYTAETPKEFDFGWMKHLDQVEMEAIRT